MAYDPADSLPPLERRAGKRFRFGSFNHSRKLNPGTVALYADVLLAVPDSELVLKSISFVEQAERDRVIKALLAAGIGEERVVLLEATDRSSDHMSLYEPWMWPWIRSPMAAPPPVARPSSWGCR